MIGSTLQRIMKEKNTNANELAKQIGASPQTLYSIIRRDNMKIDFQILLDICVALDVDMDEFYKDYIRKKPVNKDELSAVKRKFIDDALEMSDAETEKAHEIVKFVLKNREE